MEGIFTATGFVCCHAEGDWDIYILNKLQSHSGEKHTGFIFCSKHGFI